MVNPLENDVNALLHQGLKPYEQEEADLINALAAAGQLKVQEGTVTAAVMAREDTVLKAYKGLSPDEGLVSCNVCLESWYWFPATVITPEDLLPLLDEHTKECDV